MLHIKPQQRTGPKAHRARRQPPDRRAGEGGVEAGAGEVSSSSTMLTPGSGLNDTHGGQSRYCLGTRTTRRLV